MRRDQLFVAFRAAAFACVAPAPAAPRRPPGEASLAAMRALDQRVAAIGHRLAVANLDLLRRRAPGCPASRSTISRNMARTSGRPRSRAFGLDAGPAVLALAAGGPAERAGLRADDILLAFDGRPAAARRRPAASGSFAQMERILAALDEAFADGRATIAVRRGGARLAIAVAAEQGCATRFQLIPGRSAQRPRRRPLRPGHHRASPNMSPTMASWRRCSPTNSPIMCSATGCGSTRRGVRRGFLGNFGRNARRIRETEIEADRLSVYLMERAGYDPQAAVRFWSRFGRRGLNFLGSPTHPNWRPRVRADRGRDRDDPRGAGGGQAPVPDFVTLPLPALTRIRSTGTSAPRPRGRSRSAGRWRRRRCRCRSGWRGRRYPR